MYFHGPARAGSGQKSFLAGESGIAIAELAT
jgi:hypothetical protein